MEELRLAGPRALKRVHEVEEEEGGDGARVLPGQRDSGGVAAEGEDVALRGEEKSSNQLHFQLQRWVRLNA